MSLTMVSSNVAGYTKKQLTAAVLFTGYCVGNIIGPQTFISSEKRSSRPLRLTRYLVFLPSSLSCPLDRISELTCGPNVIQPDTTAHTSPC